MKKLVMLVSVLALGANVCFAGVTEDMAFLKTIYSATEVDGLTAGITNQVAIDAEYARYAAQVKALLGAGATDSQVIALLKDTLDYSTVELSDVVKLTDNGYANYAALNVPLSLTNVFPSYQSSLTVRQCGCMYKAYQAIVENKTPIKGGLVVNRPQYELLRFSNNNYSAGFVQEFLQAMQPYVRRTMRDNKESIVVYSVLETNAVVGGGISVKSVLVNPIEVRMRPMVAACNAPKFEGLEAIAAGFGLSGLVIDRSIDAEVATLQEKIWYGDINNPSAIQLGKIKFVLGTEAYNVWINKFNGK